MRKSIAYSVAMVVAGIGVAPATAAERAARAPNVLPAHEIITIVRSTGLSPVGRPTRRGTNYMLRALDGVQEVRVVVDGRIGEVISVTPVAYTGREIDPLRAPSVYDSGPPIYEIAPPVYRRGAPIIIEEEPEPPVYRGAAPVVPAPPPAMVVPPEREAVIVAPPPPPPVMTFPRPFVVAPPAVMAPSAPPSGVMVEPQPEGDENFLLPPPPPRFPQRVNVTPNPKPSVKPAKSAAKTNVVKPDAAKQNAAKPASSSSSQPAAPATDSNATPQIRN